LAVVDDRRAVGHDVQGCTSSKLEPSGVGGRRAKRAAVEVDRARSSADDDVGGENAGVVEVEHAGTTETNVGGGGGQRGAAILVPRADRAGGTDNELARSDLAVGHHETGRVDGANAAVQADVGIPPADGQSAVGADGDVAIAGVADMQTDRGDRTAGDVYITDRASSDANEGPPSEVELAGR